MSHSIFSLQDMLHADILAMIPGTFKSTLPLDQMTPTTILGKSYTIYWTDTRLSKDGASLTLVGDYIESFYIRNDAKQTFLLDVTIIDEENVQITTESLEQTKADYTQFQCSDTVAKILHKNVVILPRTVALIQR